MRKISRRSFAVGSLLGGARSPGALVPREFVLGLYDLPKSDRPWDDAREAGFDLVHVRPKPEDFDLCRQHGLRAWVSLGSITPEKREQDERRIRSIVERFRSNPVLYCWETEDEPAFVWKGRGPRIQPERLLATAGFIRALDSRHPLYLNHAPVNLETTLRRYNAACDIVATDIYPVVPAGIGEMYALWPDGQQGDRLNTTVSQVGEYTERMRRVAGSSLAVWMVLQAFAWENLREKDRDPGRILYPSRVQLRSMAYQSVIHSANGLLFWGLASTPPDAPLWGDLKLVAQELAGIRSELAAAPVRLEVALEYRENGHGVDRGVEWTARPSQKGILLICCNADRNPLEVMWSGLGRFSHCDLIGPGDPPVFRTGTLSASFSAFEARVFRIR